MDTVPIEDRVAKTVAEAYSDGQTAMAMAKGESHALRYRLYQRAIALRQEADEIDAFLAQATQHTDSWYDEIVARRDHFRKVTHAS